MKRRYYNNRRISAQWEAYLRHKTKSAAQNAHNIATAEIKAPFREVRTFQSEIDSFSRFILDYPNIETGGQLFGYWTREGVPVVCYVLGPGPKANHQITFFNQDLDYLQTVGGAIVKNYTLEHIGEWHSHHQLGLAEPSGHDAANIYNNMIKAGRERFLLCIGNCDGHNATINAFAFHAANPSYLKVPWVVSPVLSPYRAAIDKSMRAFL